MKKVFITGTMRSGTTFLANFINANYNCVIYRDFLNTLFRSSLKLGIRSFEKKLSMRQKNVLLATLKTELGYKYIDKGIQRSEFSTLKELFYLALERIASYDTQLVGVKVTGAENWVKTLLKETNVLIIVIIRDLRDVLLSSANRFATYNMVSFANKWSTGIKTILDIDDPRIFLIKFEDLVLYPEKSVQKLSDFLGVKLDVHVDALKDYQETVWQDNSAFHDINTLFDPNSVNRWKKKQSSAEVVYSNVIYNHLLSKLGYEVQPQGLRKNLIYKTKYYTRIFLKSLKRCFKLF